jgi:hypothetical protein
MLLNALFSGGVYFYLETIKKNLSPPHYWLPIGAVHGKEIDFSKRMIYKY